MSAGPKKIFFKKFVSFWRVKLFQMKRVWWQLSSRTVKFTFWYCHISFVLRALLRTVSWTPLCPPIRSPQILFLPRPHANARNSEKHSSIVPKLVLFLQRAPFGPKLLWKEQFHRKIPFRYGFCGRSSLATKFLACFWGFLGQKHDFWWTFLYSLFDLSCHEFICF